MIGIRFCKINQPGHGQFVEACRFRSSAEQVARPPQIKIRLAILWIDTQRSIAGGNSLLILLSFVQCPAQVRKSHRGIRQQLGSGDRRRDGFGRTVGQTVIPTNICVKVAVRRKDIDRLFQRVYRFSVTILTLKKCGEISIRLLIVWFG